MGLETSILKTASRKPQSLPTGLAGLLSKAIPQCPLAPCTTWRIGGPAEYLLPPGSADEAAAVMAAAQSEGWPVFYLGRGSNLLIADQGLPGITLHLAGPISQITFTGDTVKAEAGVISAASRRHSRPPGLGRLRVSHRYPWHRRRRHPPQCRDRPRTGNGRPSQIRDRFNLPNRTFTLSLLPICNWVTAIPCFWINPRWLVLQAEFFLRHQASSRELAARHRRIIQQRQAKFPPEKLTCGSVFKNPPQGPPAGWLIDQCGFKGRSLGEAQVSTRHANFIINHGRASAADIKALIADIQETVWKKHGIHLQREVVFLPEDLLT